MTLFSATLLLFVLAGAIDVRANVNDLNYGHNPVPSICLGLGIGAVGLVLSFGLSPYSTGLAANSNTVYGALRDLMSWFGFATSDARIYGTILTLSLESAAVWLGRWGYRRYSIASGLMLPLRY